MTKPVDPLTDFADLRRAGIDYAQQASGDIWTDYNLHDPGVTLLEQTCFALSQIAYQVGLPTRDLLTNPRGHFCTHDLALFKPRKVLGCNPVTRSDLVAWLCACREIDSVEVARPDPAQPGLFNMTIVPSKQGETIKNADLAFRTSFAKVRPLCTDLGRLEIAEPVDVTLTGTIEISSETLPETAAAALYHKVEQILTGWDREDSAATRADVWEAPERLMPPAESRSEQSLDLSRHLADLRSLPGIRDIGELALCPDPEQTETTADPVYYRITIPRPGDRIDLTLTLNGAPVSLSMARIWEEYLRISAEAIAESAHHIDRFDWDVMKAGRRRSFTHAHVDSLLPQLFRAGGYRMDETKGLTAEYRGAIDDVLRDMVETLSTLPRRFTPAPQGNPDDPVLHRMRIELLDYLIALQGAELPATRHSGLHCYRSTRARHRFEVAWRLEYLFALPALHRNRATGPGPGTAGGFLAELALLCDLGLSESGRMTRPLSAYGLTLRHDADLTDDPAAEDIALMPTHDPFDMLVPEDDSAKPLDRPDLNALSPFLEEGCLSPALLAQLTDADSFAVTPDGGKWAILLDPGAARPLRQIGTADSKTAAIERVQRLRATWRHINIACEEAHLVEHILLRGDRQGVADLADLILPGWTARCQMESYRSYVSARVEELAPAHVHIRLHWLDYDQMRRFEDLKNASLSGEDNDLLALKTYLDALAAGEVQP